MSDKTAIEWTDATWNPVTGCTKVSPGCANCYLPRTPAFRMTGQRFERGRIPVRLHHDRLEQPLHWRKPRRVFVVSMGDLFHEDVPDEFINRVFATMALADAHTFQVLTKRAERMRRYMAGGEIPRWVTIEGQAHALYEKLRHDDPSMWLSFKLPLPNVWLGVSVENQRMADERIPLLLETPAAVRFLSCEPLLGPLDLRPWMFAPQEGPEERAYVSRDMAIDAGDPSLEGQVYAAQRQEEMEPIPPGYPRIDWVIVGGESGPGRAERKLVERCKVRAALPDEHDDWAIACTICGRTSWAPKPHALEWLRSIRDQCQAAGVPFFLKQLGGPTPKAGGRLLDGHKWNEMPLQRSAVLA